MGISIVDESEHGEEWEGNPASPAKGRVQKWTKSAGATGGSGMSDSRST